jgi:hypothetical protein
MTSAKPFLSNVRFGSNSEVRARNWEVSFSLKYGLLQLGLLGPKSATNGLMRRSKQHYSITSSALRSNEVGTVRPSALAVFILITSSNLVGCSTGRSEGLAPLRILST